MTIKKRIQTLVELGEMLQNYLAGAASEIDQELLDFAVNRAYFENGWFTEENVKLMLQNITHNLTEKNINNWINSYSIPEENTQPKKIALIMAGNIPLVGFHDFLCVFITGNIALIKPSKDDTILIKTLLQILIKKHPEAEKLIHWVDGRLSGMDAVIATGSNNTGRYFEYYFSKIPNIIRKNRTSVAILNGKETPEELEKLGRDIFTYFGLGCRNVSKLYLPQDFNLDRLFEAFVGFGDAINNKKYANNYEYNRAIYLLGKEPFLDNNVVMIKESKDLSSPVAVIHYERYHDLNVLFKELSILKDNIQVISFNDEGKEFIGLGQCQSPNLNDYADNIDTLKFILNLN